MRDRVAACLAAAVIPGARLQVAFSGGCDSSVLLHVLAGLRDGMRFDLQAAHVHHGLSPHADAWRGHCIAVCAALGVPLHVFEVDVDRASPDGVEAAARTARLRALASLGADWLVFGHHGDDQAETVLFRLLRGSGVRGCGGMAAAVPPSLGQSGVLRPLLNCRRSEIEHYARERGLNWVEDESNADWRYARNRLRHDVIPRLEAAYPAAVDMFGRAARHFQEAEALLAEMASMDHLACGGNGAGVWRRHDFLALSLPRQRNLLRWRMRTLGCQVAAERRVNESLRQLAVVGEAPLRCDLETAVLSAYRHRLWLAPLDDTAARAPVRWCGQSEIAWDGGAVQFQPTVGAGLSCAALAGAEVSVVARWPGAGLRLHTAGPMRSFKNLCQEAGVPAWLRDRLPVLRVGDRAAWIAEIGTAAAFVCPPGEAGVMLTWSRNDGAMAAV